MDAGMRFAVQAVDFMSKHLEPGILYVSERFGTAVHLCACGCGSKVNTPLGPTDWAVENSSSGPSLWPSIGNWQRPCKSHYWIKDGEVIWAEQWTEGQVQAGRREEELRHRTYFNQPIKELNPIRRLWRFIQSLFGK